MADQQPLNGVDVKRLFETVDAVKENPDLAKFHFRAKSEWETGARTRTTIQDFYGVGQEDKSRTKPFILDSDEPDVLLGGNSAANPTEAVLHALASCLTVGMSYNAAARGIKIDKLSFDLEGDLDLQGFLGLDESVRSGFSNIRVTCHVDSDAPRDQLEDLCRFAQEHSPVFDIVSSPVAVSVELAD